MSFFKDMFKVLKDGLNPRSLKGLGELSKAMVKQPIDAISSTVKHQSFNDKNLFKDINTGTQILKDNADFALNKVAIHDDMMLEKKMLHTKLQPVNKVINAVIIDPSEQIFNKVDKVVDIGLETTNIVAKPVGLAAEVAGTGAQIVAKDGFKILKTGENIVDFILGHPLIIAVVGTYILLK